MLRNLIYAIGVGAALTATTIPSDAAESMRQFSAETSANYAEVVTSLKQRLPETVQILETSSGAMVYYTGNATPPSLAGFLKTAFAQLDPGVIATGQTVSLTMTLSELGEATTISLMVMARFPDAGAPMMEGAMIMLDGRGPGACEGQLILRQPMPPDVAAPAYREHFEKAGFAFDKADPQETSFFIGHRPGCELALYLQEDQGTSLVVIRYLED